MPDTTKIHAPSVDADGVQWDVSFPQLSQAFQEMLIDAVDIPIVLPTNFEGLVGKAVDFFYREATIFENAQDGFSTGGATVEGEEMISAVKGFHSVDLRCFNKLSNHVYAAKIGFSEQSCSKIQN